MFLNKKFYLAILSTVVVCFISLIEDIDYTASFDELGTVYYYVVSKGGLGAFFMVLTVICSIPFSDCYAEDCRDKYLTCMLGRCNFLSYCISKVLVTAMAGFLVIFIGYLLFFGGLGIITDLYPTDADSLAQAAVQFRYGGLLQGNFPFLYFILEFASESMGYAFLAVVALTISSFTHNALIIISSPVVFYYIFLAMAYAFNFPGVLFWFNVMQNSFLFFRGAPLSHAKVFLGTCAYFLIGILICAALFYKRINKREAL